MSPGRGSILARRLFHHVCTLEGVHEGGPYRVITDSRVGLS
jgi:hypothetical protein